MQAAHRMAPGDSTKCVGRALPGYVLGLAEVKRGFEAGYGFCVCWEAGPFSGWF